MALALTDEGASEDEGLSGCLSSHSPYGSEAGLQDFL